MFPFLERVDPQKTMKAHAFILLKERAGVLSALSSGLKERSFSSRAAHPSLEYESGAIKVTEAHAHCTNGFCDELPALDAVHLVEPGSA